MSLADRQRDTLTPIGNPIKQYGPTYSVPVSVPVVPSRQPAVQPVPQPASPTQGQIPDDLSLLLGGDGHIPGYDSNDPGSFERNFNRELGNFTPDQLIKRYQSGKTNQFQTPMDQAGYQAYSTAKSILGREISGSELSQILPAFQGPNGLINGRAAIANLKQQYQLNPSSDPSNPSSPFNPDNSKKTPADYSGDVQSQFKSILGRDATPDELSHFSQAIQSNQTDAYGLGTFLKQMPEYTNAQDATFRGGLNSELQNYDVNEFNREKSGITADYASRGIAPGTSPSLDYALTDLMGKIAQNRNAFLTQLSASQYGGNKSLAQGNYQGTLDQMYNQNQQQRQSNMAYGQQLTNQGFQGADYQTQMNDYLRFLSANRGRGGSNPLYGLAGGVAGAGLGAVLAGPGGGAAGATAGYQIGSGVGNGFEYLNRGY